MDARMLADSSPTATDRNADDIRWQSLRDRILHAAMRSGRSFDDITVVAVSKTVSADRVRQAYAGGWTLFGENRVAELVSKQTELGDLQGVSWHLIGQLQTNKVKDVLGRVSHIHSLDRVSLASAIQKRAQALRLARVACFAEVNIAGEASKAGIPPEQLESFVRNIKDYPNIELVGLMTIAPIVADPEEARPFFAAMAKLRENMQSLGVDQAPLKYLSMGMTADFEVAIEEGADYIRIGTAIFGSRPQP